MEIRLQELRSAIKTLIKNRINEETVIGDDGKMAGFEIPENVNTRYDLLSYEPGTRNPVPTGLFVDIPDELKKKGDLIHILKSEDLLDPRVSLEDITVRMSKDRSMFTVAFGNGTPFFKLVRGNEEVA